MYIGDFFIFVHVWCGVLCKHFFAYWFFLIVHMSITPYVVFVDGASRSTRNLSLTTWVIYNPAGELVSLQGVCLGPTTNNVVKYSVVFELLNEAVNLSIRALLVYLDSQIVVL